MVSISSELKRIASNYIRLIIGFGAGIVIVRQLVAVSLDVFNIYTLITVGVGVGVMLKELLRIALVPHLAKAYGALSAGLLDEGGFRNVYANSHASTALAALAGLCLLLLVAAFMDEFSMEEANRTAALVFLASRAVIMVMNSAMAPILAMVQVKQQFQLSNSLLTVERLIELAAVLVATLLLGTAITPAQALLTLSVVTVILTMLFYVITCWALVRRDALLMPNFAGARWAASVTILATIGWSVMLIISFNLYLRFDTLFANMVFGAAATVTFGICVQLVGMVRQITSGLVSGLDSVIARLSQAGAPRGGMDARTVIGLNTYLQTSLTGYAGVVLIAGADELLSLWLGDKITDVALLQTTAQISRIMIFGIMLRSISEGWMFALNGRNLMREYTPYTAAIAVCNPLLLIALYFWLPGFSLQTVAIVFVILLGAAQTIVIPLIYLRNTPDETAQSLLAPVARGITGPLIVAGIALAAMSLPLEISGSQTLLIIIASVGICASIDFGQRVWSLRRSRSLNADQVG